MPLLSRRLDGALTGADLAQVVESARGLQSRLATWGIELALDRKGLESQLPDGRPPIDLPQGWTVSAERPTPVFGRGAGCSAGALLVTSAAAQRWRIEFARGTCAVSVREQGS